MAQSVLVKLAMLAATVVVVLWIGWPVPQEKPTPPVQGKAGTMPATMQEPATVAPVKPAVAGNKLDLNRATVTELETLPGVGPVLAQRMVEWRKAHGRYRTVEDMRDVKGIGKKRMEQLRPLVTVKA